MAKNIIIGNCKRHRTDRKWSTQMAIVIGCFSNLGSDYEVQLAALIMLSRIPVMVIDSAEPRRTISVYLFESARTAK